MCGRYYFSVDLLDEIRELVEPEDWKLELGLLEKDMHPGDVAPVITIREDTARGNAERGNTERGNESQAPVFLGIRKMRWGFEAPGGKGLVFNARSESVLEKRMFRDSVASRRLAVPAARFYEWDREKQKVSFYRKGLPALYMAGFYSPGEDGWNFCILTTEANSSMRGVHDRMPLVIGREQVRDWILDGGRTEAFLAGRPPELDQDRDYEQLSLF